MDNILEPGEVIYPSGEFESNTRPRSMILAKRAAVWIFQRQGFSIIIRF